jgi:FHS family L-fucose permease-like MFS transporter
MRVNRVANTHINPSAQLSPAMAIPKSTFRSAMTVLSTVFFMWGFVTVLNDILVPHLKGIFELNYTQTMLIQFTFFSAYFLVSLPASCILERLGYQRTIVAGLFVMGCGSMLFIPAAGIPSYPIFLGALWLLASGMTLLQVSANPYVAALGPPETSSSRLNLVQALNSLGTTVGPAVGGYLILSSVSRSAAELNAMTVSQIQAWRLAEAASVKLPYLGITALLVLLAVVIAKFHFPTLTQIEDPGHKAEVIGDSIWRHRNLVLGALGIFVYVGAEVAIGSFLVSFFMQPEIGGLTAQSAARFVSFYWGGAMVGRFLGSILLRKVSTGPAVGVAAGLAALLVVTSMVASGSVAMWSILSVGLFNSILFPSIFTLGIAGLGKLTPKGSGIMVAAIVGGAIIPLAQGFLADRIGLHHAFFLPVICYLYIVFYGFIGSRLRRANTLA